jgi:peptide-methionine (S)-S-oxide reductase
MEQSKYEKATFGAGCFWGVEAAYRQIQGVKSTRVGYSGGHTTEPTYREVCAGNTNHAEVVEVTFDPEKVSYEELLDVFWANHDPTQVNRQGPDVGSQYRTVVFFHSPEQEKSAQASRDSLQERTPRPIATQIVAAEPFWEAEDYHQQYLEKRGLSTCKI